jgi:hypothetical protein
MNFTKDRVYFIIWADHWSHGEGGWQNHEDNLHPIYIKSIGWCTGDSKEVVRIVGHKEVNPEVGANRSGDITIIKGCIVDAWEITGVE